MLNGLSVEEEHNPSISDIVGVVSFMIDNLLLQDLRHHLFQQSSRMMIPIPTLGSLSLNALIYFSSKGKPKVPDSC